MELMVFHLILNLVLRQNNLITESQDIKYANVATPVTELYFKTTIQRGQSTDAYFTMNPSPRLNFSIAYKALRSEGRYINQEARTG